MSRNTYFDLYYLIKCAHKKGLPRDCVLNMISYVDVFQRFPIDNSKPPMFYTADGTRDTATDDMLVLRGPGLPSEEYVQLRTCIVFGWISSRWRLWAEV